MSINLKTLTIQKAHEALVKGEYSALQLAEAYLAEIAKKNKELNAYLEVFDDVREQAKAADAKLRAFHSPLSKGEKRTLGASQDLERPSSDAKGVQPRYEAAASARSGVVSPLLGIPLAVKDNILIKGRRVGAASKILEGYRASYDAFAIAKLKEAGAVFLGRTNCDEFAMGGSTENSAYGVTKNPHDARRVAGGSSGGSAAAVAADMALAALGSDTGGSVREPASFCGVVGLKPSYGAVSRSGLIALGSSLDCIGPIAKTVADTEILFDAIRGRDPRDSTSIKLKVKGEKLKVKDMRIGVPKKYVETEGIDKEVLQDFKTSLERMRQAGATVVEIELPQLRYALACYYIIMPAEASTNLARYDGVKYGLHREGADLLGDYLATRGEGFGPEVRRRILIGTYVLSSGYYDAYYRKAERARALIRRDLADAFRTVEVIATPTAPTPAWQVGEKKDPLSVYLADIFTVTANIAGIPAVSIPGGRSAGGLPLGLQLMAPYGEDARLLAAAALAEEALHKVQ